MVEEISAHVLVGNEEEYIQPFLNQVLPWFDEFVFVFDEESNDKTEELFDSFIDEYEKHTPVKHKINKYHRALDNDFGAQTNFAVSKCSNDWCMKIDVDETFPRNFLSHLKKIIDETTKGNPNVSVIGFPRVNTLDGKVVNDIPREHWFTDQFHQYDNNQGVNNLDVQYRLHTKEEDWVGEVHEVPRSVHERDGDRIAVLENKYFFHHKSRQRQFNQEQKYSSMMKKDTKAPIDTFVYDSVIYTVEGITKHAREEVKLLSEDFNICLLDQNYKSEFGEEFKGFYTPTNFKDDDYVTVVNQPPTRWQNSQHLKNRFGYLAFEGMLPAEWVQLINESNIIELWTPSSYCKELFEKSGVKKNVEVVPHGVDPEVWKPLNLVEDKGGRKITDPDEFTFLGVGTAQNDRKGLDLLAKAFSEEFGPDENVKLLFKVNKVYNPDESFNQYIRPNINWDGNTNIEYYDKNLSEEELVELFNKSDVYVSSHRAEGFGLNILNALAAGVPTIVTGATGNMDYCNEDNCLLVDVEDQERWAPFIPPYNRAKWPEPSVASLREKLRYAYENYKVCKEVAMYASEEIRSDWTWEASVDKMKERVSEYFTLGSK